MKLCNLLYGAGILLMIIGIGSICGAIEWRTDMVMPLIITAAGCALFYGGYRESGGYI